MTPPFPRWLAAPRAVLVSALFIAATAAGWAGCAAAEDTSSTDATGSGGAGGSGATTGTGSTGTGEPCPGSTFCNGVCVDTDFDPANCGVCGLPCAEGQVCSQGLCGIGCNGGTTQCGNLCVDLTVDPENCGMCGTTCTADEVCSASQCGLACLGGTTECGSLCVDVQTDPSNCGMCGTTCTADEVCSSGQCGLECLGGTTECNGACVDTASDPQNCGSCNTVCPGGQVCSGGACGLVCLGGSTKCGNVCVETDNDPENCGGCGVVCPLGEACFGGDCGFCVDGFTQCGATCKDTQLDPQNCGGCGLACPAGEVCSLGTCGATCNGGLTKCGNLCVDAQSDDANCGSCGNVCGAGFDCSAGVCVTCDSATTDCDLDGWLAGEGDCCDKPGLCGSEPAKVNPGALEVVGNGIDDNCNGKTDLFDTEDTVSCDAGLASSSALATDYAKALGICRTTLESPINKQDLTWGLIDAKIRRADGSALGDAQALSIRSSFGTISPSTTEGDSVVVISSGIASDGVQAMPGPNGGAPAGFNVSTSHMPFSDANIGVAGQTHSVNDWYATANPPLKPANGLPDSPGCNASNVSSAQDSVMLVFRLRAPTNAKAFSFNSYFFSAEYPEYVCTSFNDQFIALVDTPNGVPSPIPNPVDKNLLTYTNMGQKWPIGINIAKGTSLFAVCDSQAQNPGCWDPDVSASSCSLGSAQLEGTGFETPVGDTCAIGGGTFWLTTAGNVIPGDIVELRIAIWDVGDSAFDSLAVIDGFQWLPDATLPGTGN